MPVGGGRLSGAAASSAQHLPQPGLPLPGSAAKAAGALNELGRTVRDGCCGLPDHAVRHCG